MVLIGLDFAALPESSNANLIRVLASFKNARFKVWGDLEEGSLFLKTLNHQLSELTIDCPWDRYADSTKT